MATMIHDFITIPRTKYTAHFEDGSEMTATDLEFKNRLDFYNWICKARLGKTRGGLIRIDCRPII